jgi:pyrroloquinoline quinone biosynthesis protein B
VNASPDLSQQIEAHAGLQPRAGSIRNTPIAAILLTNADLDHVLGLLALREGTPLVVYATREAQAAVGDSLGVTGVLNAFCGVEWREPAMSGLVALDPKGAGLAYRAIPLGGAPPPYAREKFTGGGHSVAYQFRDERTGGTLVVAPDVAAIPQELRAAMEAAEVVLFDGTFWSTDELSRVKPEARSAGQMGHVTIKDGSLELLRGLQARQKVYIHINNTNPILEAGSAERRAVEEAGVAVGRDGQEFEL